MREGAEQGGHKRNGGLDGSGEQFGRGRSCAPVSEGRSGIREVTRSWSGKIGPQWCIHSTTYGAAARCRAGETAKTKQEKSLVFMELDLWG